MCVVSTARADNIVCVWVIILCGRASYAHCINNFASCASQCNVVEGMNIIPIINMSCLGHVCIVKDGWVITWPIMWIYINEGETSMLYCS